MAREAGKVYLVGAGPGAADLITLRGAEVLRRADIVFHDALVSSEVLALAASAQKVAVGKRCGKHATAQRFINKRLVDAARQYRVVVRLKGGDPLLFGRAQEEIAALHMAGIACEVVPGVTAALAAGAQLGVSLTQRGIARSVGFFTARVGRGEGSNDWARGVLGVDTAVIYMGRGQAAEIAAALIARGKAPETPTVIVENASLPGMRCLAVRLAELPSAALRCNDGPALIIIGDVLAALRAAAPVVSIPHCAAA